ncbi:MAG TPA: hypothetical protein VFA65_22560 [Bryobacteraceae bacterium]|nr:hypothetical protein [Bryobacteraceae bacterium]
MSSFVADPAEMPPAEVLDAAAADADANAGPGNVGDAVSPCPNNDISSIWVRLEMTPAEASKEPGRLRLQGGGVDKTLAIATNFVANEDTVDVLFQSVPTAGCYSLTYVSGDGQESTIVRSAPFDTLQDNSLPSQDDDSSASPMEQTS